MLNLVSTMIMKEDYSFGYALNYTLYWQSTKPILTSVVSNNSARDDFLEMLTLQEYSEYSKATLYDEVGLH